MTCLEAREEAKRRCMEVNKFLIEQYIENLKAVGMYEVDVVNKTRRCLKGQITVESNYSNDKFIDVHYSFRKYLQNGELSKTILGNINCINDPIGFLKENYEVVK